MNGFGERLKQAITKSEYSQKSLSEKLVVNQDTITNYVKESSFPKADLLSEICLLLNISSDWLLYGINNSQYIEKEIIRNNSDNQSQGVLLTKLEYDLLTNFRLLNEPDKIAFISNVKERVSEIFKNVIPESSTSKSGKSDTGDNHITA